MAGTMNLQSMIATAKAREDEVFAMFKHYDTDGSGNIEEVRRVPDFFFSIARVSFLPRTNRTAAPAL